MFKKSRHKKILCFLWKYKLATTAILYEKFYSDIKPKSAYESLQRLRRMKLIKIKYNTDGKLPLWELDKNGLKCIINEIPALRNKVLSSESREHDFLCMAIQQGLFIKEEANDIKLISEQQLRSLDESQLPIYIPSPEKHRPDGYWYFENGHHIKLMALEVELNQKSKTIYESYSYFYGKFKKNERCLWIVKSEAIINTVLQSLYKSRPEYYVHNFIFVDDLIKNGWDSVIFAGPERKQKLSSLFIENSMESAWKSCGIIHKQLLLDTSLTYRF